MAQVPTLDVPQVSQQVGAVGPQNVDSQGANSLLAGAQATGDLAQTAMHIQQKMNETAANTAYSNTTAAAEAAVSNFKESNNGIYAAINAPAAMKNIQDTFDAGKQGLSLDAQTMYDASTRRVMTYALSAIQQHTVTQTHAANKASSAAVIETNQALAKNVGLSQGTDSEDFHQALAALVKPTMDLIGPEGQGLDPNSPAGQLALKTVTGKVIADIVQNSIDTNDYVKAKALYDQHVDDLTPQQQEPLQRKLGVMQKTYEPDMKADAFLAGKSPVSMQMLSDNIAKAENKVNSDGSYNDSPKGAVGKYQIMPTTADGLDLQVNGHKFSSTNPDDVQALRTNTALNTQAHQQILQQLSEKYSGNPYLIAAAYNGGPAWLDKQIANPQIGSPQPGQEAAWVAKLNKPETRAYVAKVAGSMPPATQPFTVAPNEDPDEAANRAMIGAFNYASHDPALQNPEERQRFLQSVQSKVTMQTMAVKHGQSAAMDTLALLISPADGSPGPTSVADLQTRPGAVDALAMLPPKLKSQIPGIIASTANHPATPEQNENAKTVAGIIATQPGLIPQINWAQYPMRSQDYQTLRLQAQKAQANIAKVEADTTRMLHEPSVAQYVKENFSADDKLKASNPAYLSFVGALQGRVQAFNSDPANKGRIAQSGDIAQIMTQLAKEPKHAVGPGGFFGPETGPGYVIPKNLLPVVTQQFQAANPGVQSNPQNLSAYYNKIKSKVSK